MRWPSLLLVCAAASVAHAEPADLRDGVRAHVDAERAAVRRADDAVEDKRVAGRTARAARARAAYKVLRAGAPLWADPPTRLAVARRRAAARQLLARDRAELALLDEEAAQLDLASARLGGERALAEVLALPSAPLAWPALRIAATRGVGPVLHEASRATLSRRGLDLEVAANAPALAMADGVIRYVGPVRGLDQGVVVDHGSVVSVLARLADVRGAIGDAVRRGDTLGRAARRNIYVELRLPLGPGGLPVDPQALLPPR